MFHRRYFISIFPVWALAVLIVLSGCKSPEDKKISKMRRMMGSIPEKYKNDGAPKVGDTAYLFNLKTVEGDRNVNIASYVGDRPVVLFFGSYT